MDAKKRLIIRPEWSKESFANALKLGSKEDYESLQEKILKKTGRKFPTECHLMIGNDVIDSSTSLEDVLKQKGNKVEAILKVSCVYCVFP